MKHALTLGAVLTIFFCFVRGRVLPWPYYYDEADYMFAASLGLRANFTDHPSQPVADFIRLGAREGADPSKRARLSAESRAGSDVNFYRHWHGPLYFYWLSAIAPLHLDERAARSMSYVFPVVTALVLYFGCLWVFPTPVGGMAAVLSACLYLWSFTTVFSNEIAPHQLFVLSTSAALMLLMKWRATGRQVCWYGAVIAAACAFCTLEVAFVLIIILIWFGDKARPFRSAGTFVASVFVLWPAALLKLSFLKAYLFMGYLAVLRKAPWGDVGFLETWRHRFVESPVEWALLGLAGFVYFRFCDSATRGILAPVVAFACLMLVVLLRVNTDTPRYMLPFLPAFELAAAIAIASAMKGWNRAPKLAATVTMCSLLLLNTYTQLRAHPVRPAPRLADVLTLVGGEMRDGNRLLAPQNDVPMLHYYLPALSLGGYRNDQERSRMLARETFDALLYPGYPVNLQRQPRPAPHYLSQR